MALSFNKLGNMGRLGNQMFQYAALRGIASSKGLDWVVPKALEPKLDNYGLFQAFEMSGVSDGNFDQPAPKRLMQEKLFHFDETFLAELQDGDDISGYFQSERYFKGLESRIRQDFTLKSLWKEKAEEFFAKNHLEEPIFLHVRRGDPGLKGRRGERWSYQKLQSFHPLCKPDYYERALQEFSQDRQVVVLSDSIDWCRRQELFQGNRFVFSGNSHTKLEDGASSPYVDLAIMTLSSGAIIANSTLSWWGAWLIENSEKKIVAPSPWFGKKNSSKWTGDLIPPSWRQIYNNPIKESRF